MFAIVIGQTIRRLAAWYLERGTVLKSVEQLMGSLTVGGAVTTTYSLRAWNLTAVLLLAAWAMSPLGSQSSLLMITTQFSP